MSNKRKLTRRRMLTTSAALAAPLIVPRAVFGSEDRVAPNDRIIVGGIGVGNRGRRDLSSMIQEPDVQFVADADCQLSRRELVKAMVDKHYGNTDCVLYQDMYDVLARDDIDAVLIATGDRWHTMASLTAAKAGKDIYCEKPCSMTIAESRALADGIERYGVIYQAGTQRRSIENFQFAMNLARSGRLGKLHTVHANTLAPSTNHDWLPAEPEPPKEICDWDRWLGPCPWRPYNSQYVNSRWRGYFDFHGGGILEWGSHTIDLCQHAADADDTTPVEFFHDDNGGEAIYANGVKLVMRWTGWLGLGTCSVRFEGDEGWVETGDSGHLRVSPDSLRGQKTILPMRGTDPRTHIRNFLDCVKSRGTTRANASVVAQSHIASHAAYIAWQLGERLTFDPVKEEFIGNETANRMRSRALRDPWRY